VSQQIDKLVPGVLVPVLVLVPVQKVYVVTGFVKVCSAEVNGLLTYFTVEITSTIMQIIKITDTN